MDVYRGTASTEFCGLLHAEASVNRLILFAHFDPEAQVRPYILSHLKALKEMGGSIYFVSNSPLSAEESCKLSPWVERTLLRENTGLDFGMWQAALERLDITPFDEMVLTNSSVLGPLYPLSPIFDRMNSAPCDFWGMTESWEVTPHLQTYFLVFKAKILSSNAFLRFFHSVLPYRSKLHIVRAYELGLTTFLQEQGFRWASAFPNVHRQSPMVQNLILRKSPLNHSQPKKNPTLIFPDLLIQEGMPYLKTMLFTKNPYGIRIESLKNLILKTRGINIDQPDYFL